jgi:membrane protein
MLLLFIAIAGKIFGQSAVRGQVYWEIKDVVGRQPADVVQTLLQAAHKNGTGIFAAVAGSVTLLFGASAVFAELRDTLNYIWDAPPAPPMTFWGLVRYRAVSFAMVSGTAFLLLVSVVLSTIAQAAGTYASRYVTFSTTFVELTNSAVAFVVLAFLFAVIYKVVPEVPIDWRDVGLGAVITAALFVIGKFVLTLYLGRAGVGSPYGAAGSLVVLLVWVYYSAQIFLFGAEFTHVYARNRP